MRVSHFTLAMPYQPGTIRRSGKPCCGSSGCAVHGPDQQHVVAQRHLALQAAAEGVLVAAVEAAVGADEGDLHGIVAQGRRARARAAAACRSIRPCRPPRASRACSDSAGVMAPRPLPAHSSVTRSVRAGSALISSSETRRRPLPRSPSTSTCQSAVRHVGHVEMVEQVVQAGRRHVVAQGLQQDAVVAVGEPHLGGHGTGPSMWGRRSTFSKGSEAGMLVPVGLLEF